MTITIHADRESWLAWRRDDHRIGGTDACAILQQSPWGGPWSVYASRVLELERKGPSAEAAYRGHELEPVALARWSRRTGIEYEAGLVTVTHADEPWAFASPDALVLDPSGAIIGGVEVKTVSRSDLGYLWNDDEPEPSWVGDLDGLVVEAFDSQPAYAIPGPWLAQIYWYLACTGAPWWDLVIMGPHIDHTQVIRIQRDEAHQAAMVASVKAWRERHLVQGAKPPLDDSDEAYAYTRGEWLAREVKNTVVLVDDEAELANSFGLAKAETKAAAAVIKRTRAELMELATRLEASKMLTADYVVSINKAGAMSAKAR